ncbi:MAG: hypothetical protein GWN62_27105 [Aliifodinibius sp.]|nr:hypothetical protein [Fodinibius sp.]
MTKTYTFTARDGTNPERTLTLTLYPDFVRINLTGLWDQLGTIAGAEDKPDEAKTQIQAQAQPATLKLLETISGPVHIKDFNASMDGNEFKIQIWQRLRKLRLAPIQLVIDPVDNPDAAEAFINELEDRKQEATRAARFPGILDYWFTWAGMFLGFLALILWPQKQQGAEG